MDLLTPLLLLLPLALLLTPLLLYLSRPHRAANPQPTVLVITHTPGNHSPRALAHAHSLLRHTANPVIFLSLPPAPSPHPSLIPITLPPPPAHPTPRTPLSLLRKLLHHAYTLLTTLHHISTRHAPTHIILNSPPILPLLPILLLARPILFPRAHLTIDWHNLAYSLMRVNNVHPILVSLAKHLELLLPRAAHNHWTVSNALRQYLQHHAAVDATLVYDRPRHPTPPPAPALAPAQSRLQILHRASAHATIYGPSYTFDPATPPAAQAPLVVITSTSWTPDEEFDMLQDAIRHWDQHGRRIVVLITGKGPMRRQFETHVHAMALEHVAVWFVWVRVEEYAPLVGAADVGVCLHASSSGLDLPMKVVDMLGCGVPVVARRFGCLHELVREGETGVMFEDWEGLVEAVDSVAWGGKGAVFRRRIGELFEGLTWEKEWERYALPTLVGLQRKQKTS